MSGNGKNSFDIDSLLEEAETALANILEDGALPNLAPSAAIKSTESNQFESENNTLQTSSQAEEEEYSPDLTVGSIYDQLAQSSDFLLSDKALDDALDSDDVDLNEISNFIAPIMIVESENGSAATVKSEQGAEIALIGLEDEPSATFADIDQVLDYAVRQAELLKAKENNAGLNDQVIDKASQATERTNNVLEEESIEHPELAVKATLGVVADSWDKLRAIDVERLLVESFNISSKHLEEVVAAIDKYRSDLSQTANEALLLMKDELETSDIVFLQDRLGESFENNNEHVAVESEKDDVKVAFTDFVETKVSVEANSVNEVVIDAPDEIPEGTIALSEKDIFYSNTGKELKRFPKEFAKEITTATKRIDWFISEISGGGSGNAEDVLEAINELKINPVSNYSQVYKLGCLKLFGNEYGAPAENRKKTAQELKAEKDESERQLRAQMIEQAKSRMKSPDEMRLLEEEKQRVGSIIEQVFASPKNSLEDLLGKPVDVETVAFVDKRMISEQQNSSNPSAREVTQNTASVDSQGGSDYANAHFAIVKGKERLAMGRGSLITVSQINSIATNEGAVVIWAPSESALDATLAALTAASQHDAVSEKHETKSEESSSASNELGKKENLVQEPIEAIKGTVNANKFDDEVKRAVKGLERELTNYQRYSKTSQLSAYQATANNEEQNHIHQMATKVISNPVKKEQPPEIDRSQMVSAKAKNKIEEIVATYKSRPDLRQKATCDFYISTTSDSGRHVIGVPRNLVTNQVKFYKIGADGSQQLDNEMTKINLANMIAKGEIKLLDVGINDELDLNLESEAPPSVKTQSSSMDMC